MRCCRTRHVVPGALGDLLGPFKHVVPALVVVLRKVPRVDLGAHVGVQRDAQTFLACFSRVGIQQFFEKIHGQELEVVRTQRRQPLLPPLPHLPTYLLTLASTPRRLTTSSRRYDEPVIPLRC